MKFRELLNDFKYTVIQGNIDLNITDIIYDSRKVTKGCVFVCLVGAATDGHKYAQQAVDEGAIAIVSSKELKIDDCTIINVNDTRYALACMSSTFFGNPAKRLTTVGITGTKGKTTTTAMLQAILQADGIKTGTIGTLGVQYGDKLIKTNNTTPESYDVQKYIKMMADDGCKVVVMEASSLGLKWHRCSGMQFDYGVFTNFSEDHIADNEHASLEEYKLCKGMLFRNCNTGIVNIDDKCYKEILGIYTCNIITYSFISDEANYRACDEHLINKSDLLGAAFTITKPFKSDIEVAIPGKFSAYNALAAISVARELGATKEAILEGLKTIKVKGRVEPVPMPKDFTLLVDYAHNAMSMENILNTLREYNPNRLICMFGAGGNRAKSRRYEMGEVSGNLADLSVITEDNSRFEDVNDIIKDIKKGMAKTDGKYIVIPNRKDAIRYCIENAQQGDIIVLAGKGHEDYQETNGVKLPFDERVIIKEILSSLDSEVK